MMSTVNYLEFSDAYMTGAKWSKWFNYLIIFRRFPMLEAIQAVNIEAGMGIDHESDLQLSSLLSDPSLSNPQQTPTPTSTTQSEYYSYQSTQTQFYHSQSNDHENKQTYTNTTDNAEEQYRINPLFYIKPFVVPFNPAKKVSLRQHVFISKDCTKRLSEYIVKEDWGSERSLLYKYLDYIFRCQLFAKQVIQIDDKQLIFHTGLQRKSDAEFLYALLIPNNKAVQQKWRVGFGPIKHSFLSKRELLYKLRYLLQHSSTNNTFGQNEVNNGEQLLSNALPKRTKFHQNLNEHLFDDSYQIEVNWEERILTNTDRISKVLGTTEFTKKWQLRQLMSLFDRALTKTKKTLTLNPRLAVAQGFVDTKNQTYRMELLLPLTIEYPKFSNNFFKFALALSKSTDQTEVYTAKSILTLDMAYANARLVSYVDSSWLQPPTKQLQQRLMQKYSEQPSGKMQMQQPQLLQQFLNVNQMPHISPSFPVYSSNNNHVLY